MKIVYKPEQSAVYSVINDNLVLFTKVNETGFAPGFANVMVSLKLIDEIKNLITGKPTATRTTQNGHEVSEFDTKDYKVSVVKLSNGNRMVEVAFKGDGDFVTVRWFENGGETTFVTNSKFAFFYLSGNNTFDVGFRRVQAMLGKNVYDKATGTTKMEFGEPQYVTLPSSATAQGLSRAAKALSILEAALEEVRKHIAPKKAPEVPEFEL